MSHIDENGFLITSNLLSYLNVLLLLFFLIMYLFC